MQRAAGIRGLGPVGVVRRPRGNAYLGLPVPKPAGHWRQARREALARGDIQHASEMQDRGEFHITVLSPHELARVKSSRPDLWDDGVELPLTGAQGVRYRGLGRAAKGGKVAYFVIVEWPAAQRFREALGLSPYQFHVTVGFVTGDVFGVDKSINSRIAGESFAGFSRQRLAAGLGDLALQTRSEQKQAIEDLFGAPLDEGQQYYYEDVGHWAPKPADRSTSAATGERFAGSARWEISRAKDNHDGTNPPGSQ